MEHNSAVAANREGRFAIERTIRRAFGTAHLLTANLQQAESAVLKAIELFDPHVDTVEALFQYTVHAASLNPTEPMPSAASHPPEPTNSFLPVELQAVLNLSRDLRHCFVLRVLAGWSRLACARLLNLQGRKVDRYTCVALRCVAGFEPNFRER